MPESTQPKTRFLGSLTITPGSGTAYTVSCEDGNFNLTGLVPDQREEMPVEHRGVYQTSVSGKQVYPGFTFTARLRDIVDSTYATLYGVLLKQGVYASATSTLGANRPWLVDLLYTLDGTLQGDPSAHTILLEDCRITDVSIQEGDFVEISITGIVRGAITPT